jgi:organic radical activating enzyme
VTVTAIASSALNSSPLVSIVMPSLNQARFIDAAIESVLSQTWNNLELIVADGGSTDTSLDKLRDWQNRDRRIRWTSEADNGPANAVNKALEQTQGTVIGWLNSDDVYAPGAVQRAAEAVAVHPHWVMVYGHGQHINERGEVSGDYPTLPPETPVERFADGCFICQPTVFFKRTLPLLLGKLDESLKTAFDFDCWLRAFLAFPERIGFIDAVQAYSRFHDGCITLRLRRAVALEGMQVLARHLGTAPSHWLLTYIEELLARSPADWGFNDLRAHVEAAIDQAVPWLAADELGKLRQAVRQDTRLDRTLLRKPQENAALAMEEYAAGIVVVASSPSLLTLETTSRCNLRCVMCPHAIDAVDRPKHLEDTLVESLHRFIRQANSIQLHGIGEPLASPAFWPLLKLLPEQSQCESSINTNLTLLDERRLRNLIDSNLKIVNVSVDAARPETYRRIRGYAFEDVIENVERLLEARRNRGKPFPIVYMNMTLMRANIEEAPEFVELAARLGADRVLFWHLNRWSEQEMARYVVERDGWVFDYEKEGLWNHPALSNGYVRKAEQRARELNIRLHLDHNKAVYFEETGVVSD